MSTLRYRCDLDLEIQTKDGEWVLIASDTADTIGQREMIFILLKEQTDSSYKYRIVERLEVVTESVIEL